MNSKLLASMLLFVLLFTFEMTVQAGKYGTPRIIIPAPKSERFQHLSWPKVVTADDGTIVVAYISGRKHVNGDGSPTVSRSRDGGKTFSAPHVLKTFDKTMPYQHGANLALGKAADGAIVLMVMAFTNNVRNNIYGWRSENHGKTWSQTDTAALGNSKTGSVFGHVFPVPGTGLAVCGHYRQPKGDGLWIAYSQDDGKTWDAPQTITTKKFFEPTFIYTGGRLIGLVRENAAHAYHQYVSTDNGKNWVFEPRVIQGNSKAVHPSPFLVSNPNSPGRLYALHSERTASNEIYLWTANSEKLKWKRLGLVVACPGKQDFSYPWMTHLKDDNWFLVYYAGETNGPNSIYGMTMTIPE